MELRRVRAGEGASLRDLRLRALADAPRAFFTTLDTDAAEPPEHWEHLAAASEAGASDVVFVVVRDDRWVAMAGGGLDAGRPSAAVLWGMWVEPTARGHGLGTRLVDAIAAWASALGASRIELAVSEDSDAAAALYRGLGFAPTGERRRMASDPTRSGVFMARPL
jgi:ribosomal protein S18 acetylase RimI-like enzyme